MLRYFIHSFVRSASCVAYFTTTRPLLLHGLYHQPAHAILLCQRFALLGGTGISTSYPSPTTIVLGLGPDLPWADEPSPGNLGLSTCMFLACISLLIPAFSLLHRPRLLPVPLQPVHYAPLPLRSMNDSITRSFCSFRPLPRTCRFVSLVFSPRRPSTAFSLIGLSLRSKTRAM